MSARHAIWVRCDDCGCEVSFAGGTRASARRELREDGWLTWATGYSYAARLDLCPECRAKAVEGAGDGI